MAKSIPLREKSTKLTFPLDPYSDRVIIRRIKLEGRSTGGMILAEIEHTAETSYGEVLAIGEGKLADTGQFKPMKTEVGDIIAFRHNQPRRLNFKGNEYWILRETDIDYKVLDKDVTISEFVTEGNEFKAPTQNLI